MPSDGVLAPPLLKVMKEYSYIYYMSFMHLISTIEPNFLSIHICILHCEVVDDCEKCATHSCYSTRQHSFHNVYCHECFNNTKECFM